MYAAGQSEVRLDISIDRGDPVQTKQQLVGVAEDQVGDDLQGFEIEIRLIEAVEQYQPIGAGRIQAFGHVGHGAEVRSQLDGHRDGDFVLYGVDQVDVLLLHLGARNTSVHRDVVDIQFERIGAGLLH